MAKVYCYWGNGSNPASSEGGSNSSDGGDAQCEFPTAVVFDRLDRKQRATKSPSDGTGSTYIDASLSSEPPLPAHRMDRSAGRATPEYWDSSDGRVTTNAKGGKLRTGRGAHLADGSYHNLSDLTLTVIGIDDRIAIEKHARAKKIRRTKRQSKRRDKWSVEDLYLDKMSDSDGDMNRGDELRDDDCNLEQRSGNRAVETYHLHKANVAVGQRRCEYFSQLFRKNVPSIGSHSVEVPLSCLPAMPLVLDYIYGSDLTTTMATAVPLRYLSKLLGNRSLFDAATRFLQRDLRSETAAEYIQCAELYREKKLANVCARILAESFHQLKLTRLASLPPHLLERVLHSRHFVPSVNSKEVCSKLASYCRCQLHNIDRGTLLSLTSEEIMPVVSPSESLFFIAMMTRLGMGMEDHVSAEERSLYERCVVAAPAIVNRVIGSLAEEGSASVEEVQSRSRRRKTRALYGDYSRLPLQVKVDLLEFVVAQQQKSIDEA
ncbi:hypothetical protein ACHAXT_000306 [Thalassiosira profunda]